ncbi:hypothetical protein [Mesorhizobium sp. CAU 1732]|uniref:hypothetical protein n=1 Tax=Mesorhizobium sp. CAU 1732 TaxID=3140358 RepID=UPI003260020D
MPAARNAAGRFSGMEAGGRSPIEEVHIHMNSGMMRRRTLLFGAALLACSPAFASQNDDPSADKTPVPLSDKAADGGQKTVPEEGQTDRLDVETDRNVGSQGKKTPPAVPPARMKSTPNLEESPCSAAKPVTLVG